jgi:hypothetical protein
VSGTRQWRVARLDGWPNKETITDLGKTNEFITTASGELAYIVILDNLGEQASRPEYASGSGEEIEVMLYACGLK